MILVAVFVFCIYIRIIGGVVWLEEGRGRQHVGFGRCLRGRSGCAEVSGAGGGREAGDSLPRQALHQLEQYHQAIQQHQRHQALCQHQQANTKL